MFKHNLCFIKIKQMKFLTLNCQNMHVCYISNHFVILKYLDKQWVMLVTPVAMEINAFALLNKQNILTQVVKFNYLICENFAGSVNLKNIYIMIFIHFILLIEQTHIHILAKREIEERGRKMIFYHLIQSSNTCNKQDCPRSVPWSRNGMGQSCGHKTRELSPCISDGYQGPKYQHLLLFSMLEIGFEVKESRL